MKTHLDITLSDQQSEEIRRNQTPFAIANFTTDADGRGHIVMIPITSARFEAQSREAGDDILKALQPFRSSR